MFDLQYLVSNIIYNRLLISSEETQSLTEENYYTFPQALQWWRRLVSVNLVLHIIQDLATVSGIQYGLVAPISKYATGK